MEAVGVDEGEEVLALEDHVPGGAQVVGYVEAEETIEEGMLAAILLLHGSGEIGVLKDEATHFAHLRAESGKWSAREEEVAEAVANNAIVPLLQGCLQFFVGETRLLH